MGIGSSCGTGAAGLPTGLKVPSGERRSWGTLRGIGIRSPASRRWAASANSMASTSSPTVSGFRMPAACRMGRGSARSKRSTTTRSATWAALGSPARSQWRVRRDRSAAWRGLATGWSIPIRAPAGRPRQGRVPLGTGFLS